MYTAHFGLSQDPFSIAPDPRYLFMSERHREALAHLLYGVAGSNQAAGGTGGGFVLLTGDIGAGKTTICRCFLAQIPPNCHVAYIFNPKLSVLELLQSICEEFHITLSPAHTGTPTVKDYIDALNAFLLQSHAAGQSSVLIIDEAQNLSPEVLEQLRLLTNLETSERKLLQIVLIGQPELRDMLARPELEQLAQRVIARFHLDALSPAETKQYIGHRLGVAGHSGALPFEPQAMQRIHQLTRGVPRRINLLCGRALLGAWATGVNQVNRKVVNKAAAEVFGTEAGYTPNFKRQRLGYGLAGLALLAALTLLGLQLGLTSKESQVLSPTAAQTAQTAAPIGAASTDKPEPAPMAELQTLWPQLPGDINTAWRELAPDWKLPTNSTDPCQAAAAQQLQCYRTSNLTMPLLRQLDRPGILTLQAAQSPAVYALLVGLSDQTATLRLNGHLHTVRLVDLAQWWRGDFATYWQQPTGYTAGLPDGSTGPAIDWLASRLALVDGGPSASSAATPLALDAALRARVRAFQRTRGITPDGQPGPMTFLQIDSATPGQSPRLISEPQ
ncbi:MAG: AAA family ATPase [Rhodoferax sp.]|uniref:ExeA family protein n=1 Tax=Rhodoferax sp. TaxID=50421 RepID=UPI0027377474|nr:AAA family ATPase [Rhodoferax sp.]MDP2679750.1 AAA family ATPase [Rhodoferax sp.]